MSKLSKHGLSLLNCKRIKQARMAVNSTLFFVNVNPYGLHNLFFRSPSLA